jgi:energy-coupling factor transport system ATP-binding protein
MIELKNINYTYGGGTTQQIHALQDVNLQIPDGQFIGLIGHTGSGKSTLIQHLNGLVKATSGDILYNGQSIYAEGFSMKGLRSKVGLVFQYPEHQLFETDVFTDVCFGPKNLGLDEEEIRARAREAMDLVGLDESYDKVSPFELSGGQKRRAALAGVIAMRPEILVLDEPAAGLDPGGRREILGRIRDFQRSSGTSVIIVSHSMEDMAMYCDRIIVMSGGRVAMDGNCAEVFSRYNELLQVGLDVPQITYVADALRRQGLDIGADIYTVKYAASQILARAKGGERI